MNTIDSMLPQRPGSASESRSGFTMAELLAVLVVLGLMGSVMVTSLAGTRVDLVATQCRNHLKQLTMAWLMYSQDNRGHLVYNTDGGTAGRSSSTASWVAGWLDFSGSSDNTNVQMLVDHDQFPYGAYLGPYLKSPAFFKCPADKSQVTIAGVRLPRVRSLSMNNYLGRNSRTWASPSRYPLCTSLAQIKYPAGMFVILEERADSINDGWFVSDPDTRWQLIDYPASYHNGSGNLSFADGHVETHRWKDPRTNPILSNGQLLPLNVNLPGDVDIPWLQQRAAGLQSFP